MLTFDQIKELIDLVTERRLQGLEIEKSGFRLKIDGREAPNSPAAETVPATAVATTAAAAEAAPLPAASGAEPQAPPAPSAQAAAAGVHVLKSPIVGTFYGSPSPDADPYVEVGDRVKKGQVLCIVEAMKLMNEIECDADGTLVEIYPKNAQPVEFGEPLFAIRTS